jgi:hypothetical protein
LVLRTHYTYQWAQESGQSIASSLKPDCQGLKPTVNPVNELYVPLSVNSFVKVLFVEVFLIVNFLNPPSKMQPRNHQNRVNSNGLSEEQLDEKSIITRAKTKRILQLFFVSLTFFIGNRKKRISSVFSLTFLN